MRGGAGDHNLLPTRLARKVGGCDDKVKWMLLQQVCAVISVPSLSEVIFSLSVLHLQGTEPEQEEETCALTND